MAPNRVINGTKRHVDLGCRNGLARTFPDPVPVTETFPIQSNPINSSLSSKQVPQIEPASKLRLSTIYIFLGIATFSFQSEISSCSVLFELQVLNPNSPSFESYSVSPQRCVITDARQDG